jgi:hypothetical protein
MLVLDALTVDHLQTRVTPMVSPMLTNADVRNKFVINVRTLSDWGHDDVRQFLEDAKVAMRDPCGKQATRGRGIDSEIRLDWQRLSAQARAGAAVIQPLPGLFVGPTGNSVAPGDSNMLAGRKWSSDCLERCTVAALAGAHKVINTPKVKTDRIVFAPFSLPTEPIIAHGLSRQRRPCP